MIFVTIGTGKFDVLVKAIDKLKSEGKIKDDVLIQIGKGEEPKHCEFFRFAPKLNEYYEKADIIISHGGPGTVFEILDTKKPFIATANRDRTDPMHQVEFLEAISKTDSLVYCDDLEKLDEAIEKVKTISLKPYSRPNCWLDKEVIKFLGGDDDEKDSIHSSENVC